MIRIWLCWQIKYVCHTRTSTGLLDENRKLCCTWNWLVLYGNHVCHSTVPWLSIDNAFIKIIIKSLKIPKFDVEIRGRANGLWTLRRVSHSWHFSISTILRLWEKYHQLWQIIDKSIKRLSIPMYFTVDTIMYMFVNNLTGPWFSMYNVRKCEVERITCNPV